MARKDTLRSQISASQSLSADFTSAPTIIRYLDNVSYQINVTTTNSTGSFMVQASNDYDVNASTGAVTNSGKWVDLSLSSLVNVAASSDQFMINLNQLPFNAIRLKYTHTIAGTGTCDIWIVAKQIGG